jgi:hypothetical protein
MRSLIGLADRPAYDNPAEALYPSLVDPSSAVVYERSWVRGLTSDLGVALGGVERPKVRSFHRAGVFTPRRAGIKEIEFPADEAPIGLMRPPTLPRAAHRIGLAR